MVKELEVLPSMLEISGYDSLDSLNAFRQGLIQVQDVSSAFVGELADPAPGSFVIDVCAAPVSYTHLDVYKRQGICL